jgi:ABC-type amino acid transport substrate-binding protein
VTLRPSDLLIAFVLFACNANGEMPCDGDGRDVLADIHARGALRVGHTNDYRPFSFTDAAGAPAGIDVDLAQRLANALGVPLQFVDTTWSTLVADLQTNRYDIAMSGVSVTAERASAGCFTAPYLQTGKTALTRCAADRAFDTLAQLDDPSVTIIVNPGGTNERFVHDRLPNAHVVMHADNWTIFGALAAGAADVMITDAVEARLEARSNPALCVADPPILLEHVAKAYLVPKDPRWQAWVDAWLARVTSSGELAAAEAHYLETPSSSP